MLNPVALDYDTVSPAWFASVEDEPGSGAIALQSAAPKHEWIVRLRPEALNTASGPAGVAPLLNNARIGPWFLGVRGLGLPGQVLVSSTASQEEIASALLANPWVSSYGPNSVIQGAQVPDDVRFVDQVGLNNTGQATPGQNSGPDINAPSAWDITVGKESVVVAVLDTGIAYDHPDLSANIWRNVTESNGLPNVDDDNNGFVDDIHGYDFVNDRPCNGDPKSPTCDDHDPYDDHGHGTHVAGTIGAVGDNGIGVTGVAWKTSLMSLKVLDANNRGVTSDAIRAINYAEDMRQRGTPIRVLNASFGSYGPQVDLENAIERAGDEGILFVAAAGNGQDGISGVDTDSNAFYPASYELDNILSVAAVDSADQLAKFSNYGPTSVDLAAPGIGVLSTWAGDCVQVSCYKTSNGTSMAAPHVSGVAALIWSHFEQATVKEVRDAILEGVDHVPGLQGVVASAGRLNAYKALKTDTIAPRALTTPIATITEAHGMSLQIRVTYFDNDLIDRDRLPLSKLSVVRLGNSSWTSEAAPVSYSTANDAKSIEVTYILTPPGGSWTADDSARYDVRSLPDNVFDVVGNSVAGGSLEGFDVAVEEAGVIRVTSPLDDPATGVTLREAILQATDRGAPTKIILSALNSLGPTVFQLSRPGLEDAAQFGDLDITTEITITGEGFAATVIDGNSIDRVFDVRPGGKLRLEKLTVRGGQTDAEGGGIRNLGELELDGVVVRDNEAELGGGLYNGDGARADARATSFVANTANEGGGVYNAAAANGTRPALDSLQTVGGEVLVNTPHASQQQLPVVAMDDANNSLVVWESFDGGDSGRIYARRFDAAGNPGPQLLVNISGPQRVHPTVAMNKSGEGVIAWQGYLADDAGWGIHVRRVNANGMLDETEVVPYPAAAGHQTAPSVSIDDDGEILVVWNGMGAGDNDGVFARFYLSGEQVRDRRVNSVTAGQQTGGLAAIDADSRSLVVWSTEEVDGRFSLRGQLFDASAQPLGTELVIASAAQASLLATSLVATRDGYAVAWSRISDGGATEQLEYRLLNSSGQPIAGVVPLSTTSTGLERGAALAALADGGLIATFASLGRDGEGWGVYARQFDDQGHPRSAEFRVNSTTSGSQLNPRVAANSVNQVTIVWNGKGAGDLGGIFLQRYEASYDEDSVLAAATLVLENVTVSNNDATANGAGVFSAAEAVTAMVHATIAQNNSDAGSAGIYGEAGGTLAIKSSLIAGNRTGVTPIDLGGVLASLGYNLVGASNGATGFGRATDQVNSQAAAGLVGLPSDGTPLVHQLLPNSLAIDAADPARSPAFDQLGAPRPQDGDGNGVMTADVGAVERYQAELRGVRFQDQDGDGIRDANEPPLAGLVVYLDKDRDGKRDSDETFVVTDADGVYAFEDLPPGVHYVATESQPGWKRTSPSWLTAAGTSALEANVSIADLVAVDVDADTYLDLVALESNPDATSDRLIILKNNGQGNFAAPVYVSTGVPWAAGTLAHGDVDRDGDVDFIVAHTASAGNLTLLRNRGDGTFAAPEHVIDTANFPSAPLLVDVSGDQFVDLVWLEPNAGSDGGRLRVALNNRAGVFPTSQSFDVSGLAEAIVAGNFNPNQSGSATVDLIVGTDLLLNLGGGQFDASQSTNLVNAVTPYQSADMDGDGDLDLIGLRRAAREFGVLVNRGDGVFQATAEATLELPGLPQDVALADWDRDGDLDAAVALDDLRRVETLLNDGHGKFTIEGTSRLSPAGAPASLAVGDLNSDGFADLNVAVAEEPGVHPFVNSRGQHRADLYAGESASGFDFGELPLRAEIRGRVFHDLDQNGIFAAGVEPPLSGREVYLDLNGNGVLDRFPIDSQGTREPIAITDPAGNYVLTNIQPFLPFKVRVAELSGWLQTSPRADQAESEYVVELDAAEAAVGRDFGLYQFSNYGVSVKGRITGRYYRDANGDGVHNDGELPMPFADVYLDRDHSGHKSDGDEIDQTNSAGVYEFNNLGGGVYAVRAVTPDDQATTAPLGNKFTESVTPVGDAPQEVALFDYDGDNDQDVATANALSNDVTIVRNNGGVLERLGAISAASTLASGPSSIVTAQLDGAHGLDIAVTNQFGSTITVFLSDGHGWFVLGGVYAAGFAPTAITAGDWDQDGRTDLAVVNESEGNLRVLRNSGGGVFPDSPPFRQIIAVGQSPRAIASAQLNGDDDDYPELLVANFGSNNVTVLRNVAGEFQVASTVATGRGPTSVSLADLNDDGHRDLVTANVFDSSVTVRWNDTQGNFTTRQDFDLAASPMSLAVADIDRDNDNDLLVTTKVGGGAVRGLSVLRNLRRQGTVGFAAVQPYNVGVARFGASEHLSVAAGDLNNDGLPDVVVSSGWSNRVALLTNAKVNGAHYVELTGNENQVLPLLDIGVRSVLHPPTLNEIPPQVVDEDALETKIVLSDITAGGGEVQPLKIEVSSDNPALFLALVRDYNIITKAGAVRFTPAANKWGAARVTVTVTDGGADLNLLSPADNGVFTRTFTVTVRPVNDKPSLLFGSDTLIFAEDAPANATMNLDFAELESYGDGEDDTPQPPLSYLVDGYDPSLFAVPPTIDGLGRLSFRLAPDAFGETGVRVRLRDGGGTERGGQDTSDPQTFRLIVNAVNDAPSFVLGPDVTDAQEDGGPQVYAGRITSISPGAENERASQTVEFVVENDNPGLFTALGRPQIDAVGTIRFRAAPNANGIANLSIVARDSLGAVSAAKSYRIVVNAVNDPPSFTRGENVVVPKNSGAHIIPNWATNVSVGPDDEKLTQNVFFYPTYDTHTAIFAGVAGRPQVSADGTLRFTLADDALGSSTVTLVLFDTAGAFANPVSFTVTVAPRLVGDTNEDGRVDITDLNNVRNNFGGEGLGDADGDNDVDISDLNAVRNQFGATPAGAPSAMTRHTPTQHTEQRQRAADLLFQNWQAAAVTPIRPAKPRR
ncbi:MAG: S8 family serine peptidase [Planctomycetia bacterium]|nr:S8 family serine peptidase [Planctomycetia bacterium]